MIDTSGVFSNSLIDDSYLNTSNISNINTLQFMNGFEIGNNSTEPLNSGLSMISQQDKKRKLNNAANTATTGDKSDKKRRYLSTP